MDSNITNSLLTRRVEKILPTKEGLEKLVSERKIKLYVGLDPTGFKLHLGHGVVLKKIQDFIDTGHEIILLIGSFTGKIGDPSGKEAERLQLSDGEIEENMKDYKSQAAKILDFSKVKFVYNGDWLSKLTFEDVVRLASHFTVQQMIERDMFQRRLRDKKPIHLHEFLYPLMQGYDSVHLGVDLEIGGSDQLFNMLAGRTLLKEYKNKEKFVLTTPLLLGTNGQKMSKTSGNCVWLTDTADDMFGKLMSIPDEQIVPYMELVTDIPLSKVKEIKSSFSSGKVNPMNAKKELATTVVAQFHGPSGAKQAKENFEKTIQSGEIPQNIQTYPFSETNTLIDVLESSRSVSSRGEAKRLIEQGGIDVDGKIIKYEKGMFSASLKQGAIIRIGKRKWLKLV